MKTKLLLLAFVLSTTVQFAQTNAEIANVYLNRAEVKYIEKDIDGSLILFDKAMKFIPEITESRVARIGMLLHHDIEDYQKAKIFSKQYFDLELNKTTDDYLNMLDIYVDIEEALEAQRLKDLRLQEERLALERKRRERDSLKVIWQKQSEAFVFNADKITPFNNNGIAGFFRNGKLGLLSDKGSVLVDAKEYEASLGDGIYKILLDKDVNPTKAMAFNTLTKKGHTFPNVVDLNLASTHYGTLVHTNTHLAVLYPDNCKDVIVYDLEGKSIVKENIRVERLKELKKMDAIDKYDEDDFKVKYKGKWYFIASHLGGGIYPLFTENKVLFGYLLAANGKLLPQQKYNYVGHFSSGRALVKNKDRQFWIDQNGVHYEFPKDLADVYQGKTIIQNLDQRKHQFITQKNGNKILILDGKELPMLEDFLENPKIVSKKE